MSKRSLGVIAVILILLMAVVASAGLDNIPRSVRQSAQAAVEQLASARHQLQQNRQTVLAALASDPSLFRSQEAMFRSRLSAAESKLAAADAEEAKLKSLLQADRRQDRDTVTSEVETIAKNRKAALDDASAVVQETRQWTEYKKRTPELLADLKARYERLNGFDIETLAAPARKAAIDWPEKKGDLETRLAAAKSLQSRATDVWTKTAAARERAEAKDYGAVDYGALVGGVRALETAEQDLKHALDTTNALAAQLYVGRDKVLLDLDNERAKRQRVRVVETKYADASLQNPQVSQNERWENIDDNRFRELERAVNMVVERKPPGKYETDSDKHVQAPGYAYIAPAGQANQYGAWQGGVWHWLPQYLILSQLLRGPSYPPVRVDDYYNYDRYRRSGGTWYGGYGRTWSGSGSGIGGSLRRSYENWTRRSDPEVGTSSRPRERWSWGGSGGSYEGSRYQNRGSYGGSRYQSRPSSGGFGSRSYSRGWSGGRSFGRGRR